MIENVINEINNMKEKIIKKKITDLELETCIFFRILVDNMIYILNTYTGIDYNLIKIFKEIKEEYESRIPEEVVIIERHKYLIHKQFHEKDFQQKKPFWKLKKTSKISKKKTVEAFDIIISEQKEAKEPLFTILNKIENNCWILSYNYLFQIEDTKTLTIERSLFLKFLLAYLLTFKDFIYATSDEKFLCCLNKFTKLFYYSSLKKLLKNSYIKANIKNVLYNFERNSDYFLMYDQYSNSKKLLLWNLYGTDSDTEFYYMKDL